MAVYTDVTDEALFAFLALTISATSCPSRASPKALKTPISCCTARSHFILTLYEKRVNPDDLPFFIGLMEHLAARRPCPLPVKTREGKALGELAGRPAAIVTFLDGVWFAGPTPHHCAKSASACAHASRRAGFPLIRGNGLSVEDWAPLFESRGPGGRGLAGPRHEITEELELSAAMALRPAKGIIHADLFNDNVFFIGQRLSGLIDFYFACNDALAYDLAICLNAWCFEPDSAFNATKGRAML